MTKILPSDNKARLVIADDVRQELGGKLSILGVYPGNSITLNTEPDAQPVLSSLCLLWWFIDGEGEFAVQISVIDPSGQKIMETPVTSTLKKPEGDMNFIVKISPFTPAAFGMFKCRVTLDEKSYEREFTLIDAGTT